MLKKIDISTSKRIEFLDITSIVSNIVSESNVKEGICLVYVPHTTCGLTINEHADPSVVSDIINHVNKLVPYNSDYKHLEGNSDAHIKASIFGSSLSIIISNGKLLLGTWQGIFLCEFDGPRKRNVYIKILEG
ncbi:MAG TPA: secondary thiamine-phosphate synthase enzyme YjbQ [Fervidobacterium nodosum]|nr:secondary thiamine-phosphate synthase enzyme YjbQ [Fervidobacterium nodosum]